MAVWNWYVAFSPSVLKENEEIALGAGFYLDATNPKWSKHYRMLTHVTLELPQVIEQAGFPVVRPCPYHTPVVVANGILVAGLFSPVNLWTFNGRPWRSYFVPFFAFRWF